MIFIIFSKMTWRTFSVSHCPGQRMKTHFSHQVNVFAESLSTGTMHCGELLSGEFTSRDTS